MFQQVGPPQAVYERPANLFVGRFIGNPPMNTITGDVTRTATGSSSRLPGNRVPLPAPYAKAIADAGLTAVVLGVRPEHLQLDGEGLLPATVSVIESLGHERHVICRLEDGQMVIVRQQSSEPAPGEGSMVRLAADQHHLHIFDEHTERRIEPA